MRSEVQEAPTRASLRGVSVASPDVCWASGSGGTFLRTIDGGQTWAAGVVPGAEDLDFRDVEALDANRALLLTAGSPGQVWSTVDGGLTWERRMNLEDEAVFLDAMDFEGDHGLAWGDPLNGPFLTLETTDAGETWSPIGDRLPKPAEGEAGFAASGTCVSIRGGRILIGTGGSQSRLLLSEDAGVTWTERPSPLQQGEPSQGTFSVCILDDRRAIAVGGNYSTPEISIGTAAYSQDGGHTWQSSTGQSGYRSCVAKVPIGRPRWAFSISKIGASLSTDGGASWRELNLDGHYAVDFARTTWLGGRAVGYAVGAGGKVMRVEVWP